jgi:hypothetical protein
MIPFGVSVMDLDKGLGTFGLMVSVKDTIQDTGKRYYYVNA